MSKAFRSYATLPPWKMAVIALTVCPHLVIAALEVPDLVVSLAHALPARASPGNQVIKTSTQNNGV